jgi:CRISPR/Cas system-associated exonuclease Cas4 (RecB family)
MRPSDVPPSTSASQLTTYAMCPRKYELRYVLHAEPESRAPGLALGSAVHSAVAWYFDERAAEREPSIDDVARVLRADLDAATSYSNMRWASTTPEKLRAEADLLVRAFLAARGELPVKETEVRFDLAIVDPETGEEMRRPLVGYVDMELVTGNFIELKTARRAYSEVDLRTNLQFACYRTAARYYGVDIEVMAIVRTKRPRLQHVTLPHDGDVSRWFMRAAASIERAILAGHFPPAPGPMCASCEYRRACLGVEARDTEVADAEEAA